jgi:O-antigen/teichoic acid export membrane protein
LLGILVSPASIGYLSVPKNLVFRVKEAVDYVGSTLFPKFSSMQNQDKVKALFLDATWIFLGVTLVIFVPVVVLFPDLLRLWISPEFSVQSSGVARIIACSYLVRGAFVPFQYLWRGLGLPKYNTVLYSVSGIASLVTSALLIPIYGLDGAGYCHAVTMFLGFGAIVFTWKKVFHEIHLRSLFRPIGLPIIMGIVGLFISGIIRSSVSQPGLFGMILMAAVFSILSGFLILAAEYFYGRGDSRSLYLFRQIRDYFPIIKGLKIEFNISRKP